MKNLSLYQQVILLTLTFFLLVITVAIFHKGGILTVHEFKNELIKFEASNEILKKENEKLRFEIKALKFDPLAIETLAREKLGMVHEREIIYQLVPEKSSSLLLD